MKKLVKGNEAVVIGALVAGCDAYYGYPITPASEIAHAASEYFLPLGKVFVQAECEIGAINMVFGSASSGLRTMTASSGPGISLKMEGISYLAGAELPCVIVDVQRVGPGLGNIGPEQSDYYQVVKGGGHGDYRAIVLAPASVEETYRMTIEAFDLADKWRTPVFLLTDATLGQMMEPIDVRQEPTQRSEKPWALDTKPESNNNLVTSIYLDFDDMEVHINQLHDKYQQITDSEAKAEVYGADVPDIVLTGYGITGRMLRSAVDLLKDQGINATLVRPQTLWPFPTKVYQQVVKSGVPVLSVELSRGQFVEDVRLSLPGHSVKHYGRVGGNLPGLDELVEQAKLCLEEAKNV
ncbi:3-methyl-2-oxobutanoate dehydrogenase subunit VorB [Syntrophotalea acetylenivorans]|uniref:3-methyl-2-oxobutanoate dehydrogenase subunit VorB n=1 Tax=Syntrophotalea acetylenivorans TaxID=1842532 RepID=UPI0009F9B101|nr:3-methyl-2-oxobutanoate dehydrogenase subunit VorB [Syntrophotalea acetylenivorans]